MVYKKFGMGGRLRMRKSFKQVVSGLLAVALLLPGGLTASKVSAADPAASNSQIVYQETF